MGTEVKLILTAFAPTFWQHANYSERWYSDVLREAAETAGEDSKRKEIIFAACFLESYIFEWTRGICIDRVKEYFPPVKRYKNDPRFKRSLEAKWANVPTELYEDKVISACPRVELSHLGKLVRYRNGLIHAQASRPVTADLSEDEKPVPALDELKGMTRGWARDVATNLVLELHQQLGTMPPEYMK